MIPLLCGEARHSMPRPRATSRPAHWYCADGPHDRPSAANALVAGRRDGPELALELRRVPAQRVRPSVLQLLQPLRRLDELRGGPEPDRSPRQLIFQSFLPNPWVIAPFASASLWSVSLVETLRPVAGWKKICASGIWTPEV